MTATIDSGLVAFLLLSSCLFPDLFGPAGVNDGQRVTAERVLTVGVVACAFGLLYWKRR